MNEIKYIGMDVHQASIVIVARSEGLAAKKKVIRPPARENFSLDDLFHRTPYVRFSRYSANWRGVFAKRVCWQRASLYLAKQVCDLKFRI